jgi:hypothetical protein
MSLRELMKEAAKQAQQDAMAMRLGALGESLRVPLPVKRDEPLCVVGDDLNGRYVPPSKYTKGLL